MMLGIGRGWRRRLRRRGDRGEARTEYAASAGMLTLSGIAGTVLISATTGMAGPGAAEGAAVEQTGYSGPQQYGGCDATGADRTAGYDNGRIPTEVLCELDQAGMYLRADAAVAFLRMDDALEEEFGHPMPLNAAYRDYAKQVELHSRLGYPAAARPGTSNHGLGLAVDIDGMHFGGDRYNWVNANSAGYGWFQPEQMREGGSNEEPWHWEYESGVSA